MLWSMQVTRDVLLDCSTDEAWELLTDPDALSAWLGRPADFEIDVVSEERVTFVWSDGGRPPSMVEFQLEEVDGRARVTVTETGFEWEGRPYRSLSAVARDICGQRWNGLLFFGLTQRKARS